MEKISFLYKKADGEEKDVSVINWKESGRYILGVCADSHKPKTYRKDRVVQYHDGAELLMVEPFSGPPPIVTHKSVKTSSDTEILFTGFPSVQRAVLENKADEAGMVVVKSVTKNLSYLCGGPTAGPAKLDKARSMGVWILNQPTFLLLIETGELPDEEPDFV